MSMASKIILRSCLSCSRGMMISSISLRKQHVDLQNHLSQDLKIAICE
ncbi:MAG: hypothetical protein LM601_11185 [Candidatus Verstraetearchaeota archaeon]|nr:hypothetical protein [Candidatus Verstraetearchaeota archaeon]